MTIINLARIVADANVQRLSLVGLAKNVGKTTTTNYVLESLLSQKLYQAEEMAITSLGLDGEALDALTGLPKPRYVPQAGILVATTADLLRQAEDEGARFERLLVLPGKTALGPVILARVSQAGRVIFAGPTLLSELRSLLDRMVAFGARLTIIDGAINRLGAAAPNISDACIICTGTSAGATPEVVARRTAGVYTRLMVPQSTWTDEYKKLLPRERLVMFSPDSANEDVSDYSGVIEPTREARWILDGMQSINNKVYLLRGAFTEELSRELLRQLSTEHTFTNEAELVVGDGTKIFCHPVTLRRLAARGLHCRVATPIRILALVVNPYTPEYHCTPRRLIGALVEQLPDRRVPIIDVVAGQWA